MRNERVNGSLGSFLVYTESASPFIWQKAKSRLISVDGGEKNHEFKNKSFDNNVGVDCCVHGDCLSPNSRC